LQVRLTGLVAGTLAVAALLAGCTQVPDVVGQSAGAAKSVIEGAWLRVDDSGPADESMQPINTVAAQEPAAGETARWWSSVKIRFSKGTVIDNYVCRDADEAEAELKKRGLTVTTSEVEAAGIDNGIVADQTPKAGEAFNAPDGVKLLVSVGTIAGGPTPPRIVPATRCGK
jgi:beta-lactam-binding protein with PASTA domain